MTMIKDIGRTLRCDVYGCGETTSIRIGKEENPTVGDISICQKCLFDIVKGFAGKDPSIIEKLGIIAPSGDSEVQTISDKVKLSDMSRNDLIAYAKDIGVQGKLVTFSREQLLVEILKSEGR